MTLPLIPGTAENTRPETRVLTSFLLPLVIIIVFLSASCSPDVYHARVDAASASGSFEPTEFTILRGQQDIDPDSQDFRRYSAAVAGELERLGFSRAKTVDSTHVFVYLRFGLIGEEVPHQGTSLEHLFMLEIEARDAFELRAGRGPASLWKVTATAHGHLDHRHKVFKVLLAACVPFFGKSDTRDVRVHRDPVTGSYEFYTR
jgi:hypothetical protein